jgi:hypothetical protein
VERARRWEVFVEVTAARRGPAEAARQSEQHVREFLGAMPEGRAQEGAEEGKRGSILECFVFRSVSSFGVFLDIIRWPEIATLA